MFRGNNEFKLSVEDLDDILTIASNDQIGRLYKAEVDELVRVYKEAMTKQYQTDKPIETGCKDKNGDMVCLGDKVIYYTESKHPEKEYWNPVYRVIWDAPEFTLKWLDEGGLDGFSHNFILKYGGANSRLEIIDRSNRIYKL